MKKYTIAAIIVAIMIVVIMIFTARTVSADSSFQPYGTCGENTYWSFNKWTSTLRITGWNGTMDDYYYKTTPWEPYNDDIRTVIISGVQNIGEYAFYEFTSLKHVYIGYGVKSIDYYAFRNCSSLESVTLPYGINNIGWSSFQNCTSLKYIYIPNTVTTIRDWAFAGCTNLMTVSMPNSVKKIGNYAFDGCSCTIWYSGTEKAWNNIDTGYYNEWLQNINVRMSRCRY